MEEKNAWLDPEEVKHTNKKSVRPEIKNQYNKTEKKKKYYKKKQNKDMENEEVKNVENVENEEVKNVENVENEEVKNVENVENEEVKNVENKEVKNVENKDVKNVENKDVKNVENKEVKNVEIVENEIRDLSEDDLKETRELPLQVMYISKIKKDEDEKIRSFLKTLLEELDYLPNESRVFAEKTFGKEWLEIFLKTVQDVKTDIFNSKFFPSEDKMILLKFIFLLKQAL